MIIVGDSLSVGTAPYVHARTLAQVGRTLSEGAAVIRSLHHPHVLVVALGTNDGPLARPEPVVRLARRKADCVVWVSSYRRGYSFSRFNARLPLPHVRWAHAVAAHPEWLQPDGTHCTPQGYRARARLVMRGVKRFCA